MYVESRGAQLHYSDVGSGKPVVLLHGVWMSSEFFRRQTMPDALDGCRVISLDFRGHGLSDKPLDGYSIAGMAEDVSALLQHLALDDVTLVGWSMGAFVAWEYLLTFGTTNVGGLVIVDESASDFSWPEWQFGVIDPASLAALSTGVQGDQIGTMEHFVPEMFVATPQQQEAEWMVAEMCKVPPVVATTILVEQTLVDYRDRLGEVTTPTLVCFGRDEKLLPVAAGEDLVARHADARLVVFESSSHCPFLEESELFNQTVSHFATQRFGGDL